jgi:hypothetical protein
MYNDNLFALKIDRKTKADCMKKKVLKLNYYNYVSRVYAQNSSHIIDHYQL